MLLFDKVEAGGFCFTTGVLVLGFLLAARAGLSGPPAPTTPIITDCLRLNGFGFLENLFVAPH